MLAQLKSKFLKVEVARPDWSTPDEKPDLGIRCCMYNGAQTTGGGKQVEHTIVNQLQLHSLVHSLITGWLMR